MPDDIFSLDYTPLPPPNEDDSSVTSLDASNDEQSMLSGVPYMSPSSSSGDYHSTEQQFEDAEETNNNNNLESLLEQIKIKQAKVQKAKARLVQQQQQQNIDKVAATETDTAKQPLIFQQIQQLKQRVQELVSIKQRQQQQQQQQDTNVEHKNNATSDVQVGTDNNINNDTQDQNILDNSNQVASNDSKSNDTTPSLGTSSLLTKRRELHRLEQTVKRSISRMQYKQLVDRQVQLLEAARASSADISDKLSGLDSNMTSLQSDLKQQQRIHKREKCRHLVLRGKVAKAKIKLIQQKQKRQGKK